MSDRGIEMTIPLEGLTAMETVDDLLRNLERLTEVNSDPRYCPVDVEAMQEIDRMEREIRRGGCGFELHLTAELRSADAGDSDE